MIAIIATNFWLGQRAQSYFDDAIEARDLRIAAVELRNAMQTAEASERGFVITGNEIYLGPLQTAKSQAQRYLQALETLLPSYPDAEPTLQRLSAIITMKLDDLDQLVALKRDQRDAEILAIFRTNRGKALTDEANVFFAGIIGRADDRLTSGVTEQRANTGWVRIVSAIGGLVIVVVVAAAAYGAARYTRELRDTRDEVRDLNNDLEKRVVTRTEDLAKARDRAEVLLAEVNHRVSNSLTLVSSLVHLQARAVVDRASKEALAETQDRIFAISLVHRRLYGSSNIRSVSLDEYLTGLLDHLRTSLHSKVLGVNLSYDIAPVELETDTSINLGVVVTELVTNAFKYAYPGGIGEIRVRLRKLADEQAELLVEDDGVGKAEGAPAKGTGVGSRIISAMCSSLGALIEYRNLQPGTAAQLVFSTKPRRATAA